MDSIRVLIVDDHAVVRDGTRQLIDADPGLTVVGEAESGRKALQMIERLEPDIVLLDLALPDLSGIEVARQVQRKAPSPKIVILSAYDDADYVSAAMEIGVSAYLLKTVRGQEVVEAIHGVSKGQVILHPDVAAKLARLWRVEEPELTPRALEVLRLAASGLHNKDIAEQLSISVRTIEGHLSHILSKLDVGSRTEAVVYGLARGWFTFDKRVPDLSGGQ